METETSSRRVMDALPRHVTSADRFMWITPDRVFYVGLLGVPSVRTKGAVVIYVGLDAPLRIRIGHEPWSLTDVAVVQPNVSHHIACDARHIGVIYLEPETLELDCLPAMLRRRNGVIDAPYLAANLRRCHEHMVTAGHDVHPNDFDCMIFGEPLVRRLRGMDPRIATVVERIRSDPATHASAEECASRASLSFSRFLHLFKKEVGVPFRSFRAWKRARSLLHYVKRKDNLVFVALDAGYPDSTHFSHSIRQVYGLKPKDIFAGSRKLNIVAREVYKKP